MDHYRNHLDLSQNEIKGKDYHIFWRLGRSGIAVMAPHGGDIEPGTTEIADALAGETHSFYSFCGAKDQDNLKLHIPSTQFDEPLGFSIARNSKTVLTIHGAKRYGRDVSIGGRDEALREKIIGALQQEGFTTLHDPRLPGVNPKNICNQGTRGMGAQLEISVGLRRMMFQGLEAKKRRETTVTFLKFFSAIKKVLSDA